MIDIGDRIKGFENNTRFVIDHRQYTIIRVDGRAFSSYTRTLNKPYDVGLIEDFDELTKYLCSSIMGCRIGYTQSDEITFILTAFEHANSQSWFGGTIQKMTSSAAAMATAYFNYLRYRRFGQDIENVKMATFDARVFSVPTKEDAIDCLQWRQQDAARNSVSMIARQHFSHKEMQGLSVPQMKAGLLEKGVRLSEQNPGFLYGRICTKETHLEPLPVEYAGAGEDDMVIRKRWEIQPAPRINRECQLVLGALPDVGATHD